jgi:hypothetical protein
VIEEALSYLRHGWSVVPIAPSKRPLVDWSMYQSTRATPDEVRAWWKQWPDANIAVVTGAISGVVVVDVDAEESVPLVQEHMTEATLVAETGRGGRHYYFRYPEGGLPCAVGFMPHVDCRGDGGLVVVPPSVHENGRPYTWLDRSAPAPLPEALRAAVAARHPGQSKLDEEAWTISLGQGERDTELTRRAGKLFRAGMGATEVLETLLDWNRRHCVPPLAEGQVRKIVASIEKRQTPGASARRDAEPFRVMRFGQALEEFGYREEAWTIKHWLPRSTCALVVAPPGNYKTWLLLDLALSISSGRPFLGRYPVEECGPVLFVQQEDPFPMLFNRLASIMNTGETGAEGADFLVPVPPAYPDIRWHPDRQLNFDNRESLDGLAEAVASIRPAIVILDPLYSAIDAKDYMAAGAKSLLFLKQLRDEYGTSFMIAHHTVKRTKVTSREELWGSQFLNAWLETGWQIRPGGDEEHRTVKVQRHHKNSGGTPAIELTFEITPWAFRVRTGQASDDDIEATIL